MKHCRICGIEITPNNIYRGQHGICKVCDNARRAKYLKNHSINAEKNRQIFKLFYANHKKEVQEHNRNWKENNPERNNHNRRLENRLRKYRVKNAEGKFTTKEWDTKLKEYNSCCAYCNKPIAGVDITIDHVIPLSKGGTNYIDNLIPACLSCNVKKYNSIPPTIKVKQGFL